MKSNFTCVGIYSTPLEACEAIGVSYIARRNKNDWKVLPLKEKSHSRAGRIRSFPNGTGGIVCNWRDNTQAFWFNNYKASTRLTPEQKRLQMEAIKQCQHEEMLRHLMAASFAKTIFIAACKVTSHPYLDSKHVKAVETLRCIDYEKVFELYCAYILSEFGFKPKGIPGSKGTFLKKGKLLVVPMRGELGVIQTIQIIDSEGGKAFFKGGLMKGAYWQSESLPETSLEPLTIGIGEGVATVLSVRQIKSFPVVAAMNCGNLVPVARTIRNRFPNAKIIVLSDVGNGQNEAVKAALSVNGVVAIPQFSDELRAAFKKMTGKENPTDFNDYYLAKGDI